MNNLSKLLKTKEYYYNLIYGNQIASKKFGFKNHYKDFAYYIYQNNKSALSITGASNDK